MAQHEHSVEQSLRVSNSSQSPNFLLKLVELGTIIDHLVQTYLNFINLTYSSIACLAIGSPVPLG